MANSWYAYLGQRKDPLVPASYRRVTIDPLCQDGCTVCAIYLLGETSTTPSTAFTTNLLTYITNGLIWQAPQPNSNGVKYYVYLKSCS